jgi:hypothetical protein
MSISASFRFCSKQIHTAHQHAIEGRICYPFHPRSGESVLFARQYTYRGSELVVILQPDGSVACIPSHPPLRPLRPRPRSGTRRRARCRGPSSCSGWQGIPRVRASMSRQTRESRVPTQRSRSRAAVVSTQRIVSRATVCAAGETAQPRRPSRFRPRTSPRHMSSTTAKATSFGG